MKKPFLLFTALLSLQLSFGQILNSGFRNWTFGLDSFGISPYVPEDTFSYLKLDYWTSLDAVTGNPYAGGKFLVNRALDTPSGRYVVRINTDSIFVSGTVNQGSILPGFMVNGNFAFNAATLLISSNGLNPANLAGAGSAISQRYAKIAAYVKYQPIPGDSMLIWAVLKKNSMPIAQVKLYNKQASTGAYQYIEGAFTYSTCDVPDSVALLIASSNVPVNIYSASSSGLRPGSVLYVDSVLLVPFSPGYSSPVAPGFNTHCFSGGSVAVQVSASDTDCTGMHLSLTLLSNPSHGSAYVSGDSIYYHANAGFGGNDTLWYSLSNGMYSSSGYMIISVLVLGIENTAADGISLYPNPTDGQLLINGLSDGGSISLFSCLGQLLGSRQVQGSSLQFDLSAFEKGLYLIELRRADGTIAAQRKVVKQ